MSKETPRYGFLVEVLTECSQHVQENEGSASTHAGHFLHVRGAVYSQDLDRDLARLRAYRALEHVRERTAEKWEVGSNLGWGDFQWTGNQVVLATTLA